MDFFQSLELLKNATTENIAQQLLSLNRAIHNADEKEILAIYFTLEGLRKSAKPNSEAWSQIYELMESAVGRMSVLVALGGNRRKELHKAFTSAVGLKVKLENALV